MAWVITIRSYQVNIDNFVSLDYPNDFAELAAINHMALWHTEAEKRLLRLFGGEWAGNVDGADGTIDGRPAEVRVARDDDRFRIQRDVHRELVEERGSYVFDVLGDGRPPKRVPATEVTGLMPAGEWYEDRDYPHKFVDTEDVFPPLF